MVKKIKRQYINIKIKNIKKQLDKEVAIKNHILSFWE